jgi:AcrR family transcriptional regulator
MSITSNLPRPEKKSQRGPKRGFRKTEEAVYRSTAELLLEKGFRNLRTLHIAERVGITESTLFRSYGKLEEVLEATYNWAWDVVVREVSQASFIKPGTDPRNSLLQDTNAVWALRGNPETRIAANYAFLFSRRKNEFALTMASVNEDLFTARLQHHCKKLVAQPSDGDLLATFLVNYIITVWLTWETMPQSGDAAFGRDLSQDEAQMGVLVLLEQFAAWRKDDVTA